MRTNIFCQRKKNCLGNERNFYCDLIINLKTLDGVS